MDKFSIDEIFEKMSSDNEKSLQLQGIEAAGQIKNLSVLFQPIESKALWENCAIVISSKSDEILQPYIMNMFEWLKDMNWPGADIIYHRLLLVSLQLLTIPYEISLKESQKIGDDVWEEVLIDFMNDYQQKFR